MQFTVLALISAGCHDYGLYRPLSATPGLWEAPDEQPMPQHAPNLPASQSWHLAGGEADLLFFGDTSGSMQPELETLGEEAESLVSALETYDIDWQLLAVTGPDGCGNNGVISRDDPDFASRFAAGLTLPPGEDDVDEWGLYNALEAIRMSEPGRCNEGFLRTGATLQVVFISDEDDNSPGWDSGDADYWRDYTDEIRWHHPSDQPVIFSAIAGPDPGGCSGAEPGVGYWQAAEGSGGATLSICERWQEDLELLAQLSAVQQEFVLDEQPVPWSIVVWVDGQQRWDDWRYAHENNAVLFERDPPLGGQDVVIEYRVRSGPP